MAELPETARQKLKHWVAGPHPDANLLSAFAENSLSARERGLLVEHLAACASCREVVALAAPQDISAAIAPVPEKAVRQWAMLRWGTAAAILVVMVGVVWLGRTNRTVAPKPAAEVARAMPELQNEPVPAEKQKEEMPSAGAADAARPPALPDKVEAARPRVAKEARPAPAAEAKAQAAVSGLAGGESASKKMAALDQLKDRKLEEQQVQLGNEVQLQKQGELRAEIAQAAPAPSSAMKSAMARRPAAQAGAEAQANAPVAAAPADAVAGGLSAIGSAQGAAREALPAPGRAQASKVAAAKTTARWSISANGDLQRSLDDGVTWQDEPLAAKAVFRAVSAMGKEIWAGGNAGALFHSGDGGGSWARVTPAASGATLSADIVRINFADAQRGSLTTSTGQTWLTTDGGRTWTVR